MSEKATYIIDLKDAFSPKLKQAAGNLDGFENKMGRLAGKSGSGGLLGTFGAAIGRAFAPLAIAAGLTMFTGKIITLGAEMEQTKVSMEVLVGDAEKANELFNQMSSYASDTVFGGKDITDAGKLLLSFGTAAEDVMPTIAMLGDISGGNAEKLGSLSLAFAQMSSSGRLMGQDLLQMINAGFNPLQVISEKTGKSIGDLKKIMEDGGISSDMVKQAFVAATSEGGRFFNMVEKQAETMSGKWQAFTGTLEHSMATFGMRLGPAIVKVIGWMDTGLNMLLRVDFSPFITTFERIWDLFKGVGEAFGELWTMIFGVSDGMTTMQKVFDILAISMRASLTPLRFLLEGLKILFRLADDLGTALAGLGKVVIGMFTFDPGLVAEGLVQGAKAAKAGFTEVFNEIKAFAQKEKDGWAEVFAGGTPEAAKEKAKVDRFAFDKNAFDNIGEGTGKGKSKSKTSKVDGEVRSGGAKNITINITQLVGEVKFESLNKMSENQVVEIIKRALLTAVNDANVAIQ